LKYVGGLWSGLAYLSRYNSGWFCHSDGEVHCTGGSEKQSRGGRRTEGAQRKKKEGKSPRGSFGKLKSSKDFPVK
jgi:hypothetical protein